MSTKNKKILISKEFIDHNSRKFTGFSLIYFENGKELVFFPKEFLEKDSVDSIGIVLDGQIEPRGFYNFDETKNGKCTWVRNAFEFKQPIDKKEQESIEYLKSKGYSVIKN